MREPNEAQRLSRRRLFSAAAWTAAGACAAASPLSSALAQQPAAPPPAPPTSGYAVPNVPLNPIGGPTHPGQTEFQIGCFTFPYRRFPLQRGLEGIARAGFRYVGWATTYLDELGQKRPVLDVDAELSEAKALAKRCRDLGLEPHLMFSTVLVEESDAVKRLTHRIKQASAAGVSQVITFGQHCGANRGLWIDRLKQLGPVAADHGVLLVLKQHGVDCGSGKACAEVVRDVNHPSVQVNYDAGKVQQMLNIDPLPDLRSALPSIHSLCIRDHRYSPKDEDCGPGLGEIDHYQLLGLVAQLGRKLPICCETVLAPLLPLPPKPEDVDILAVRARIFLELVVAGLQLIPSPPLTAAAGGNGTK